MPTKILDVFGRLFKKPEEKPKRYFKMWHIMEGPIAAESVPALDLDPDRPKWANWLMVIKIEDEDGEIHDDQFWFETLDEAYDLVRHFKSTIDPIVVEY